MNLHYFLCKHDFKYEEGVKTVVRPLIDDKTAFLFNENIPTVKTRITMVRRTCKKCGKTEVYKKYSK